MRSLSFGLAAIAVLLVGPPSRAHTAPPEALTRSEWVVEDIGGMGVVERSRPTIAFSPEGAVSGNGSCNRFMGGYALHDADIAFTPLATTRMACAEALMRQERAFLDLLGAVVRYQIEHGGTLRLFAADGRTITARP